MVFVSVVYWVEQWAHEMVVMSAVSRVVMWVAW